MSHLPATCATLACATSPDRSPFHTTTEAASALHAAIAGAESEAQAAHDAGVCHLSEFSCSACEGAARP